MEKYIDQSLNTVTKPDQCLICEVKLINPSIAKSHYDSKRHKMNVELFRQEVKKRINSVKQQNLQIPLVEVQPIKLKCSKCNNMTFPSQEIAEKHYASNLHKNFKKWFCKTCGIITTSDEQMWNHMKGTNHQNKVKELGVPPIDAQYSPFRSNLSKELKDLMLRDSCNVCQNTFPTIKQALAHYNSVKHDLAVRHWFNKKRRAEKQKELPAVEQEKTKVVNRTLGQSEVSDVEESKRYCYLCKVTSPSRKANKKHTLDFPHKDLIHSKCELSKQGVIKEFWTIRPKYVQCKLCDLQLYGSDSIHSHFNCKKHLASYSKWLANNIATEELILESATKWFYCKSCNIPLNGTSEAENHYSSAYHNMNNTSTTMQWFNSTYKPENPIRKADFETCQAMLDITSESTANISASKFVDTTANMHLNENHNSSIFHDEKEKEPYCEVCAVRLATPALMTLHNMSTIHLENLKKHKKKTEKKGVTQKTAQVELIYSNASVTTPYSNLTNEPEKPVGKAWQVMTNTINSESIYFETTVADKAENDVKTNKIHPEEIVCTRDTKNLKQQVFNQLEQLIQKLYYSKTVPYEVSLEYLKKMNKKVDELSRRHSEVDIEIPQKNVAALDEACGSNMNDNISSNDGQDYSVYIDHSNAGNVAKINLLQNAEHVVDDEAPLANLNIADGGLDEEKNTIFSSGEDEMSKIIAKNCEVVSVPAKVFDNEVESSEAANVELNNVKEISDLLSQIVERKSEVERTYPNELVVEKEVLNEIESLLRSIESGSVPLQETLKCLESFNEELEATDFLEEKTDSVPYEENLQCLENASEELEWKGGGTLKKLDKETPKYTYSVEDLFKLRTEETFTKVSPERKSVLTETGLWRRRRFKSKLTPADGSPLGVYKYYNGTSNFQSFMDFSEVYLHESIKNFWKKIDKLEYSDDGEGEKSDKETAKYTYSAEELLNLRTEDTFTNLTLGQEVLTETGLLNERCSNHDLAPADDCQFGVYKYCSDTSNFEPFMDFSEAYSQGSTENLGKNEKFEGNDDGECKTSDKETSKYTYSAEELLNLRTEGTFTNMPSRHEVLIETGLLNERCTNHNLAPADDCQVGVYKYCSDTSNFEPFMDFSEACSQGSAERLEDDDGECKTSDKETSKYTYSAEKLLNLRTEGTFTNMPSRHEVLIETGLLNECCTNHNLIPADDCQVGVYKNCNNTSNFEPFMDFSEAYSQGSTEKLGKNERLEDNNDGECKISGQPLPKYTYSMEELLILRTSETFENVNPELSEVLINTGLLNRYFNNHNLPPADKCQLL